MKNILMMMSAAAALIGFNGGNLSTANRSLYRLEWQQPNKTSSKQFKSRRKNKKKQKAKKRLLAHRKTYRFADGRAMMRGMS